MSEITLLPCPYCGGEAEIKKNRAGWLAGCSPNTPPCQGETYQLKDGYDSPEYAAAAWNRRAPQPLTVIVPPIEWGERKGFLIQSKCGRYDLRGSHTSEIGVEFLWMAWSNEDKAFTPLSQFPVYETIAKLHCKNHAQATVDKAIKGCKIEPYHDPQGLVDALSRILNMPVPWYKDGHPSEKEIAQTALKEWEDGK